MLEGNQDSVHETRTSLHPPIVTRSLRLVPLTWHQRVAMTVELQGCTHLGGTSSPDPDRDPTTSHPDLTMTVTRPHHTLTISHPDLTITRPYSQP